jgi:hypothetical protein
LRNSEETGKERDGAAVEAEMEEENGDAVKVEGEAGRDCA